MYNIIYKSNNKETRGGRWGYRRGRRPGVRGAFRPFGFLAFGSGVGRCRRCRVVGSCRLNRQELRRSGRIAGRLAGRLVCVAGFRVARIFRVLQCLRLRAWVCGAGSLLLCDHTKIHQKKHFSNFFYFSTAAPGGISGGKQQKSRRFSLRAL